MTDPDRQPKLEQFRKEVEGLQNVIGVAWDPEAEEFVALVAEKIDEEDLPEDQLVASNTSLSSEEHGVVEVGHIRAHGLRWDTTPEEDEEGEDRTFEPESSDVHRPVAAGAEEQPGELPFVGTGSFLARVTDPSKGTWADDVQAGSVVRLSNWHVYVVDEFEPHRPIHQPHGGGTVGELVGGVPLEAGVPVDAAARSVSEHDGWGTIGLDTAENGEPYGRSVTTDVTDDHAGKTVTKSGRTTDVTTAEIRLIDVSVDVDYGEPGSPNPIRIEECVITSHLGDPGDSGSAVYLEEDGSLCGLYFAGSGVSGVFSQIGNVESAFGVEPITDWTEDHSPVEYDQPADELQRFKEDLISFVEGWSP